MASSSSKAKRNYDVFLSFRGTDVSSNFLSHLYTTLNQIGLFTYIDSEELRKGEQISLALMKAIEESRVAIIIFSEDYASSPWCLEELVKIMECKKQKNLVVLPVFYKVEPREVRQGRKSYGKAMAKHVSKFGKDPEKVKTWKIALFDAVSLSGWDLNDGDEATVIKEIVKVISKQPTPLHVAKHPVGIHRQVEELEPMLNLESDEVLMIGLWGQGGIGKTTLAKALYNANFRQFEGACFLRNIREDSKDSKDLLPLQKKLLEMLLGKELKMFSVDEGITLIQDRLCHKKVLLVLDDVDDVKQLNALAGECDWFGKGSRIIITTRDNRLLTSQGIDKDHIYAVKPLNNFEALELFNKHAFPRYSKIVIRRDLVDGALDYANGLPLALEILSSFLCGREELEWESALNKLAKSPNKIIEDVIKKIFELKMYDVFLSFRGKDVREYFVKGLNEALVQKGIKTFMDSENLLMGQDFPSKLKEAIEQSRMYVVFFSENYAESWWCLKELVQIQGEKNRTKQLLPIFYKVAPGEVRGQNPREMSGKKQSYEKALTDHESEFGKRKVKKWKEALSRAANVNGIHLHDGNMHGCIPRIVKEMEKMMQRIE